MACGSGKTFTALKIAEEYVKKGGNVLFLVPSISLLSQSLNDFVVDRTIPHRYFVVCSDVQAGNQSEEDISIVDLAFPPTTKPEKIAGLLQQKTDKMTVVFSTYHSLEVSAEAQKKGAPEFDLIICDEAHRTVGAAKTITKGINRQHKEPDFSKVHNQEYIKGKKRLYMTATPKIYSTAAKKAADERDMAIYSMDDPQIFGEEFYRYSFSRAVNDDVLSDYKVHIFCMSREDIAAIGSVTRGELQLETAVKLVGCWNAMRQPPKGKDEKQQPQKMKRVVAFTNTIKESQTIEEFMPICAHEASVSLKDKKANLILETEHIDGTMGATMRSQKLGWLRDDIEKGNCRILTNARCLTEGIDVPALDGVVFFSPRKSQIDIVQAVGRVMRIAKGKKVGNVILPVVLPPDTKPENFLNSDKAYKHVWQVLSALRSHDDRFEAEINKVEFNRQLPNNIHIDITKNITGETVDTSGVKLEEQLAFGFRLYEWTDAVIPKFVENCGNRHFWHQWVKNVADIAASITKLIDEHTKDPSFKNKFDLYFTGLKSNINDLITEGQAVQMLAQHIITKPVFDALFQNYEFSKHNAISQSMDGIVAELKERGIEQETKTLENFYKDVASRANNINTLEGRQNIMETLYNEFFQGAFKKEVRQAGIVYTPTEVVDFINRSVDYLLHKEFGVGITDKHVHVLDPFTGTGRFIVRLLASDLITDKDLERKYKEEIHVNEKLLLPYYIANVNIEQTYHSRRAKSKNLSPYINGVLCDTFQVGEEGKNRGLTFMQDNKERAKTQSGLPIKVIISNPPYSVGAKNTGDAQNPPPKFYPKLDKNLSDTFIKEATAQNRNALYDSYIRAIRWSIDKIPADEGGIVGFITNAGFLRSKVAGSMRKSLIKELSDIYILDLRGNQRTQGEVSKREGGKIFGGGSRTPTSIVLMIKKPGKKDSVLNYYDIGDYLNREEKLSFLVDKESAKNIKWQKIISTPEGDWLNKRDPAFKNLFPIADSDLRNKIKKANAADTKNEKLSFPQVISGNDKSIFSVYTLGIVTGRDAWVYDFSKTALNEKMRFMTDNYNNEVKRYLSEVKASKNIVNLNAFLTNDGTKIRWNRNLIKSVPKGTSASFDPKKIRIGQYRPFCKKYLYYDKLFNTDHGQTKLFFKDNEPNPTICVSNGSDNDWSSIAVSSIPDYGMATGGTQCFPFYIYYDGKKQENILDGALQKFQLYYKNKNISKMDIFYYIYSILHHRQYQDRFSGNLARGLPRIPFTPNFSKIAKLGKSLADLHTNYEEAKEYDLQKITASGQSLLELNKTVDESMNSKMSFGKNGHKTDKSILRFNDHLTFAIPAEAYEYKVSGKSPVEWVVDRYKTTTDKDSSISQNSNDWSPDNPRYILSLLKKAVTIGIESTKLIESISEEDLGID